MKTMKKSLLFLLIAVMVFSLSACGGAAEEEATPGELNVYMWSEYMSESVVQGFEEEFNIKVNFSYMNSSEEATAKLTSGGGDQYDLVMPCDADMTALINGGHLAEMNLDNIPNFANLGEAYKYREFDPENKYAMPYLMNYVYVIYNPETCPIEITKYQDLFSPELKGQISSITGIRNLFPIALVALGYDPNSSVESEIAEAYEWLKGYMANVKVLSSDDTEQAIVSGECSVALVFDGQAGRAFEAVPGLKVADLSDPIQLGVDELVIPANAKNKENAELFLNYLLDAEVMAENLIANPYTCPNVEAIKLTEDSYKLNPAINIPQHMKDNYFLQLDVGEAATVYDEYWTMLLSEQ
ncbi:MAG: spermidine/putrescine ABC transporter substrate-binding protein [Eubacteriales bacterium]|nr:spermidine/putrescine ABC transporter substrate-binding protein [Eubacteriales bacterium]